MGRLTEAKVGIWFKVGKRIAGKSDGNGLTFTLSPGGAASWVLRYRFAGRLREITLGRYPEHSLEDARKLARRERVLLDEGFDPQAERRKRRLALTRAKTFDELATDYMLRAAPDLANTSRDEARRYLKRDILPRLGALRIEEVTGAEIVHLVEQVAKRSDASARRAFQITSVIFSHGLAKHLAKSNPCAGLKLKAILGKARPVREKISLTAEELGVFLRALPACGLRVELALRILLATGTRKGELLAARKSDVDLEKTTWTIPAENSKNGKAFVIPLASPVLAWFRELTALAGPSELLVPGRDPRRGASHGTLNKAIAGLELTRQFGPHTLRRTMRSHLGALGVDIIVAEKCLNHTLGGLIDVYDRGNYLEQRRDALERWAAFLLACEQGRPCNIQALRAVA